MFTFSLSEVVLLTLVVGLALGWRIDRKRLARKAWNCQIDYACMRGTVSRLESLLDQTDKDWRDKNMWHKLTN